MGTHEKRRRAGRAFAWVAVALLTAPVVGPCAPLSTAWAEEALPPGATAPTLQAEAAPTEGRTGTDAPATLAAQGDDATASYALKIARTYGDQTLSTNYVLGGGATAPLADVINVIYEYDPPIASSDIQSVTVTPTDGAPLTASDASGSWVLTAASSGSASLTATVAGKADPVTLGISPADSAMGDWIALQRAFAQGGTITLDRDYRCPELALNGTLMVPEGKSVSLDLNGHSIDRGAATAGGIGRALTAIEVQGTLAIRDSADGGKITGSCDASSTATGAGIAVTGGTLTLESGSIEKNKDYGVWVERGSFSMTGGTIRNHSYATAVRVDADGSFAMTGGSIEGNSYGVDSYTAGVYVEGGSFSLGGDASITGNDSSTIVTATGEGATFTMEGNARISDNLGDAVSVTNGATFTMKDGTISGNVLGVGVVQGSFDMQGGSITANKLTRDGGGLNPAGILLNGVEARLHISGDAVVSGNVNKDGKPANVGIFYGAKIEVDRQITSPVPIGISAADNVDVFTSGYGAAGGDGPWKRFVNEMDDGRLVLWNADRSEAMLGKGWHVSLVLKGGPELDDELVADGQPLPESALDELEPRAGYHLSAWCTDEALTAPYDFKTPVTADLTLHAAWQPNAYRIRFDKGASDAKGSMADQELTYDAPAALARNAFERPGHAFVGWSTTPDGTASYADGASVQNLSPEQGAVVTLYAQWQVMSYDVVFDARGGSAVDSQSVAYGSSASRPADPARDGFRFAGWYADEALSRPYDFSAAVTGDITLFAKWEAQDAPSPAPSPRPSDGESTTPPSGGTNPSGGSPSSNGANASGQSNAAPQGEGAQKPAAASPSNKAHAANAVLPRTDDAGTPAAICALAGTLLIALSQARGGRRLARRAD